MGLFTRKKKEEDFEEKPVKIKKQKPPKEEGKKGRGKVFLLLLLLLPVLVAGGAFGYFIFEKGNRLAAAESVLKSLSGATWAGASYNLDVLGFYKGDQGYLTVSGFALKGAPFSFSASTLMVEQGRVSKKGKEATFAAKSLYLENASIGSAGGMKDQAYTGKFGSVDFGGVSITYDNGGVTKFSANTMNVKNSKSNSVTPFGNIEQSLAAGTFSKVTLGSIGKSSLTGVSATVAGLQVFTAKSVSFDGMGSFQGSAWPEIQKFTVKDAKIFGGNVGSMSLDAKDGAGAVDIRNLILSPAALKKSIPVMRTCHGPRS